MKIARKINGIKNRARLPIKLESIIIFLLLSLAIKISNKGLFIRSPKNLLVIRIIVNKIIHNKKPTKVETIVLTKYGSSKEIFKSLNPMTLLSLTLSVKKDDNNIAKENTIKYTIVSGCFNNCFIEKE
jgi:hypothetical protein